MYELIPIESLTAIQKANMELSLMWKIQSYELISFELKGNDNKALIEAILWCGERGHAIPRVPDEIQREIAEYIAEQIINPIIESEEIKVFKYKTKNGVKRKIAPNSWLLKVLHILDPKSYPLAFDQNTCMFLGVKDFEGWKKKNEEFKEKYKFCLRRWSEEEIYKRDSIIWAKYNKRIIDNE